MRVCAYVSVGMCIVMGRDVNKDRILIEMLRKSYG